MRRIAVIIGTLLLCGGLAHAASVDVFVGAASPNGSSGTDVLAGAGLDLQVGEYVTVATRLTRMDLDGGYATGLTVAGEWGLVGALYGTAGGGLTWYERDGEAEGTAKCSTFPPGHHKSNAECSTNVTVRRDGDTSAVHLQGGVGALIPARAVSIQVEAVYRVPVHDGAGGVVGTVGLQIPLP